MNEADTKTTAASWTVEPAGWVIAFFAGLWGALVGIGFYLFAYVAVAFGFLAALFLFANRFDVLPAWKWSRSKHFARAALIGFACVLSFGVITFKAQKKTNDHANKVKGLGDNVAAIKVQNAVLQTNFATLASELKQAASQHEEIIVPFDPVVCTRRDEDCQVFLDSDQVKTQAFIVGDLPQNRKLVRAWCVAIDNLKDLVALQSVTVDIDPTAARRNVILLKASRAQPLTMGRVRYAIYAATEPIIEIR